MKPETEILVDLVVDVMLIAFAIVVMASAALGYVEDSIEVLVIVVVALLIRILGYLSRIHRDYVR